MEEFAVSVCYTNVFIIINGRNLANVFCSVGLGFFSFDVCHTGFHGSRFFFTRQGALE
jgi:hypothetical protein